MVGIHTERIITTNYGKRKVKTQPRQACQQIRQAMSVLGGIHKRNGRVRRFSTQREAVEMQRQSPQLRESQISYISNTKGTMTTDYTPYVIIDDVTMSKVMERLNQGKAMAEKSYPHLTADFERVIKQVRERSECFTGSQNKPKATKAYGR